MVVEKVRKLKKPSEGLNAATGEYEDLVKAGVIDAAKVTRSALQNAASIAALFLTTEAVIADKPEEGSGAGGMPGGGMEDFQSATSKRRRGAARHPFFAYGVQLWRSTYDIRRSGINPWRAYPADPADFFSAEEISKAKRYVTPLRRLGLAEKVVVLLVDVAIVRLHLAPRLLRSLDVQNWVLRLIVTVVLISVIGTVARHRLERVPRACL